MGAELRFQIADIDSSHARNYGACTMLVILLFIVWNAREHPFGWGQHNFCELGADSEGCRGAYPWTGLPLRLCCSFSDPLAVSDKEGSSRNSLYGLCA